MTDCLTTAQAGKHANGKDGSELEKLMQQIDIAHPSSEPQDMNFEQPDDHDLTKQSKNVTVSGVGHQLSADSIDLCPQLTNRISELETNWAVPAEIKWTEVLQGIRSDFVLVVTELYELRKDVAKVAARSFPAEPLGALESDNPKNNAAPKTFTNRILLKSQPWADDKEDSRPKSKQKNKRGSMVTAEPIVPVPVEMNAPPTGQEGSTTPGTSMPVQAWSEPLTNESTVRTDTSLSYDSDESEESLHPYPALFEMVDSAQFDSASGILVLVNSLSIGVQTDYMARHLATDLPLYFRVIDSIFCLVFTAEIFLRVLAFRLRFFYMPGWGWNVFDCILVGMQLVEEVSVIAVSSLSGFNFSFMRVLRILRLVRIVRIIRVLRLIGELRTIVASILGSLKSLAWTVVLLFLMIYVIGICFTQLVVDYRIGHTEDLKSDAFLALENYYGSLPRALLSLYQAILGGIDWDDLADPLITEISPIVGFLFAMYIAFAILALMNVVTGVFVESALKSAKEDRDKFITSNVRSLFCSADTESSGVITWEAFQANLNSPQMLEFFRSIGVDTSEARGIFYLLDVDESGTIELDEFLSGCIGLHGPAKAIDLATLMYETRSLHKLVAEDSERKDVYNRQIGNAILGSTVFDEQGISPVAELRKRKSLFAKSANRNSIAGRQSMGRQSMGRRASVRSVKSVQHGSSMRKKSRSS